MTAAGAKARQREAWGAAPWEPMAARFAALHDDLVSRLAPRRGERWLDVGTGTGAAALRAAEAGARVTGVDLAPGMIGRARQLAWAAALPIRFEVGDAERLVYPDASFDVVASALGVFLAPDHTAAAHELGRVCRPGGRLGVAAWRRDPELEGLHAPYRSEPECDRCAWGRESHVERLLERDFELEFVEGTVRVEAASGEEAWRLHTRHQGPMKVLVSSLPGRRAERYRRAFVGHYERYRDGDRVSLPRRYLLTLGRRRTS